MKKMICCLMGLLLLFGQVTLSFSYTDSSEVKTYIEGLELGNPFNYQNLTIVPVYSKRIKDRTDYVTLDEAITKGYLIITELDGGRVPQVRLTNNSSQYILLIAGEILSGCKQDRLVGRDALIGPGAKDVILPVYCSEQGRWTSKGSYFTSEGNQAHPMLRSQLYKRDSQSEIWGGIARYSEKCSVRSSTSALQDVYKNKKVQEKMDSYVKRLESFPRLEEDAVGIVVGLGDKVIGIDLFVNPGVFSSLWPKLLKSYVALAISEEVRGGSLTQKKARDMLNDIYRMKFSGQSGLHLGEELQANQSGMVCSALVYRQELIHLAAFPTDGDFGDFRLNVIQQQSRVPVIE